jgi:hypothetical protein
VKALKFGARHKYVDLGRGNSGAFDFEGEMRYDGLALL